MASGSSAPYGDIIHVLGRPRCGLCCVKKKAQDEKSHFTIFIMVPPKVSNELKKTFMG
jgi:hypothetical protein